MSTMPTSYPIRLRKLELSLAVCRLDAAHAVEPWMQRGRLWSITRTPDELSVICECQLVPAGVRHESPFATFMVEGPLDFSLTGIVARLSAPLADRGIPMFICSTFDTDYVLVRDTHSAAVVQSWVAEGLVVTT